MKIAEEEWDIVKHRIEAMPSQIRMEIGPGQSLSKDEILEHIERRDSIGERIVAMQMKQLRFSKNEMADLEDE